MSEALACSAAAGLGVLLGAMFFGGLWWTISRALPSKQPAVWFLSSLLVRMAVVLTGFFAVGGGDWRRLAACLIGFVASRFAITRLARFGGASTDQLETGTEVSHAP